MPRQDEAGRAVGSSMTGGDRSAGGNSQPHADYSAASAGGQLAKPAHGQVHGTIWRKTVRKSAHLSRLDYAAPNFIFQPGTHALSCRKISRINQIRTSK
jgi:hypothetical protein